MHTAMIVAGVRTPIGSLGGAFSTVPVPQLGGTCIREALKRAGVQPDQVDEVVMGNVVSAGVGQNPARQASLAGGLPDSVPAATVNKVCGSGLKSVMLAGQSVTLGESEVVVAGGMENMSLAPYLLPGARAGYRMGHQKVVDSLIHDGLWDVYGDIHMGIYGDRCGAKYGFTREQLDDFAVRSYTRARQATADGIFAREIVPVEVPGRKGPTVVSEDEEPARFNEDKLRSLRPAFDPEGTVTAGNASSINDGAAAVVVVSEARCQSLNLTPVARIVGWSSFSREPEWFTLAPIGALKKLMEQIGWSVEETDLFEINEAFSTVTMAAETELGIPSEKCNVLGGAVALGHPIGCSGTRVLVTLLNALEHTGGRRGIASLCIGGGESVALAVERLGNG